MTTLTTVSLSQEINDIYVRYLSLKQCSSANTCHQLMQQTNKSKAIVKKLIQFKEQLHPDLLDILGDRKKLTQQLAQDLCRHVKNTDIQISLYHKLQSIPKKQHKQVILETKQCMICCEDSDYTEVLPCCKEHLCSGCMHRILKDSVFETPNLQLPRCPYCRSNLLQYKGYLKEFTRVSIQPKKSYTIIKSTGVETREDTLAASHDLWRNNMMYSTLHKQIIPFTSGGDYLRNISRNEDHTVNQRNLIALMSSLLWLSTISDKLVASSDTHYLGFCSDCIRRKYTNKRIFKEYVLKSSDAARRIKHIGIGTVEKDCAQNNLSTKMFICETCRDKRENVTVKSCPHCGVNTIIKDGCHHIRCQCGGCWCFVCNLRVPGTHEGHNVHYYRGVGTGPYDNHCRISEDTHREPHILENCPCVHCRSRGGAPLCAHIDCNRAAALQEGEQTTYHKLKYHIYCKDHL